MIVQMLRERQEKHGYLKDEHLVEVAQVARVPLYRVEEVVSFFPHFRRQPPPPVLVQVCRDMSCHLRGAPDLLATHVPGVGVEGVSCLGRCDRAPVICVSRHGDAPIHEDMYACDHALDRGEAVTRLIGVVRTVAAGGHPPPDTDDAYDARRGKLPWSIDYYGRHPEAEPYAGVKKFIAECKEAQKKLGVRMDPASPRHFAPQSVVKAWLDKLSGSGLAGMGGGGAPAGGKWNGVYLAEKDVRYVVANGDESEPATFKDRELMLRHPELLVEGAILACLLTGATRGYIFIRHEYGEAIAKVEAEIRRATLVGACGDDVLGTGRVLPVEVFVSPGGYICGEQSALLEAMEDRRAQPRNKPPDLSANGLFDMPTVVNNVETLAWAPAVLLEADDWYKKDPRRLFSISGDVAVPGVYELSAKEPLRTLVGDVEGELMAVATSGPSGGFMPAKMRLRREGLDGRLKAAVANAKSRLVAPFFEKFLAGGDVEVDLLDFPLDLNFFRAVGEVFGFEWSEGETGLGFSLPLNFLLGAGIVAYATKSDLMGAAVNATEFFRNESCGKCVPCRLGSDKLVHLAAEVRKQGNAALSAEPIQLELLMQQMSICSLGVSAPKPLLTVGFFFLNRTPASSPVPPHPPF